MQRLPVYWLYADRYTGDMTLTQALKENMGDPVGETGRMKFNQEALVARLAMG